MHLKRVFGEELHDAITSDDVLGKDVIDAEGDFLGVVEMLHLDPNAVEVVGITIDKGFLRRGLVVGKDYIERVAPHAVFLKIRPAFKLKGMTVYDNQGEVIGIVVKPVLHGKKNQVEALVVRSSALKKDLVIPAEYIRTIGYNVLLNTARKELKFESGEERK